MLCMAEFVTLFCHTLGHHHLARHQLVGHVYTLFMPHAYGQQQMKVNVAEQTGQHKAVAAC